MDCPEGNDPVQGALILLMSNLCRLTELTLRRKLSHIAMQRHVLTGRQGQHQQETSMHLSIGPNLAPSQRV